MIIVKNRELLIPENERYIGTNYDTNVENRLFRIARFSQNGTDLQDLVFKINLIHDGEVLDREELAKSSDDDYIYLTWKVTSKHVSVIGTVFVCITGNDTNDTVKWSSFQGAFYTEKGLGDDIDTEYKNLINKVENEINERIAADAREKGERTAADMSLSERLDNIVSQAGTDNTEIVDARIDSDGTPHRILKARLDSDYEKLDEKITQNKRDIDNVKDIAYLLSEDLKVVTNDVEVLSDFLLLEDNGCLIDNYGRYLSDASNNHIKGTYYRTNTDTTGEKFGTPADAWMVGHTFLMGLIEMGLPIMYLSHPDIETLKSKSDGTLSNVAIDFPYKSISTDLKKFKVQGASSQYYPKKNYTITFDSDVILNDAWGKHKKYVIKADWVDFSQMRNEICAKLWGQIRKTRINASDLLVDVNGNYLVNDGGNYLAGETDAAFAMGLNYGAVDGYPICVMINGKYWGLYSLMIPKDDWMAGMKGENQYESIISIENGTLQTAFKALINRQDENGDMYGTTVLGDEVVAFGNEYSSDTDDISWLKTSLNRMISSVMSQYSNREELLEAVSDYVDVDSVIDYYIFNCMVNNLDGMNHNYLLDTWDGVKWYFAAYDMDGTLGNEPSGKAYYNPSEGCTFRNFRQYNKLIDSIYLYDSADLKSRYKYLRTKVLSESNFASLVWNYAVNIPKAALDYEALRWPARPGTSTNNLNQILDFFRLRCQVLDSEIDAL